MVELLLAVLQRGETRQAAEVLSKSVRIAEVTAGRNLCSRDACGLRGWQTSGSRDGCLQRVRYTGAQVATVAGMRVLPTGLELRFTTPLDPASATDSDNYALQRWNHRWSEKYGSDLYSATDLQKVVGKKGDMKGEQVEVKTATLSPDGMTLILNLPTIQPVMQMATCLRLRTVSGQDLSADIFHTINKVPAK